MRGLRLGVPQLLAILVCIVMFMPTVFITYYPVGGKLIIPSHGIPRPFLFPDGGRTLFPDYRMVALYGTPDTPALGVLGEQGPAASIARVNKLARQYKALTKQHILPTLEIIATVASASPTADGDYSYAVNRTVLERWVEAARQAGVYVVLDLQSGRSSFLKQAKQLRSLLAEPNVGLALDPEWRLRPHELPLEQVGSASIGEVNQTVHWLARLTRDYRLPQKLLLLHQFRLDMLPDRNQLDTSHTELAYAIQMDGQGGQGAKLETWQAIRRDPPEGVYFGWKNFYDEDHPMRSIKATMQLSPKPWYISYQ